MNCLCKSEMNSTEVENPSSQDFANIDSNLYPLSLVIPFTIIYVIIFITGVIGNVVTCVVIVKNKELRSATNYYLFSLACSDLLLVLSSLPPEMYRIWSPDTYVFGQVFCVIQGYAAETSAYATVLTITAFTIERYLAICHPLLTQTMSKLSRAVRYIAAIWTIALVLAVPQAAQFGVVVKKENDTEKSNCTVKNFFFEHVFIISTCVIFVGPMTLITILYILIGIKLKKSQYFATYRHSTSSAISQMNNVNFLLRHATAQRRVVNMLSEYLILSIKFMEHVKMWNSVFQISNYFIV